MLSTDSTLQLVPRAQARAARQHGRVGRFPYLAEALRQAGVRTVHVDVASRMTTYRTADGVVVDLRAPIAEGLVQLVAFDRAGVIVAIRRDQGGESTYDEFLSAIWGAGVLTYDVDLDARTCTYVGAHPTSDIYVEPYGPATLTD